MVKIVNGEPCSIHGPNSDVLLHVPRGVCGAILANVYTNNARFLNHIPSSDCLVSPVCEYHLQPSLYQNYPQVGQFKIQIPHIVKDVNKVRPHIRVSFGNLYSGKMVKVNTSNHGQTNSLHYEINEQKVIITTSHFSGYIITAEAINCCAQSACALLFGCLRNVPKAVPLAIVKVFLSSVHLCIEDYQMVSIWRKKQNSIWN